MDSLLSQLTAYAEELRRSACLLSGLSDLMRNVDADALAYGNFGAELVQKSGAISLMKNVTHNREHEECAPTL